MASYEGARFASKSKFRHEQISTRELVCTFLKFCWSKVSLMWDTSPREDDSPTLG